MAAAHRARASPRKAGARETLGELGDVRSPGRMRAPPGAHHPDFRAGRTNRMTSRREGSAVVRDGGRKPAMSVAEQLGLAIEAVTCWSSPA